MPLRRPAVLLAVVAAAVPLASGCGRSDEDQVRDTISRFEKDAKQGDFQDLCKSVLASRLVDGLQNHGLPCDRALRRALGTVIQPSIEVQKVRVRGDVALALVTTTAVGQRPSRDTLRLVKEKGNWRVSALSGPQPPAPQRNLAGQEAP